MKWFKRELGDGQQAAAPRLQIGKFLERLEIENARNRTPSEPGAAMFSMYPVETNVVTVYLTPEYAHIAHLLEGFEPCEKPPLKDIGLEFGSQEAWRIHFPEKNR